VRSFNSPTRALGTLFFVATQLYWVGSTLFRAAASPSMARLPFQFQTGTVEIVSAFVFGFFGASSWLWGLGLFTAPFGFQKADSDCLFPTPVDNRAILNLQLVRNTLVKLMVPLVGSVLLWRPVKALSDQIASGEVSAETTVGVFRTAVLVYFLLMTWWTIARYASVLTTAGTEKPKVDLRRRLTGAVFLLTLTTLGLFLFGSYTRFQQQGAEWTTLVSIFNDRSQWWLQPVGALGATVALGPVNGAFALALASLGGLLLSLVVFGGLCYRNAGRLSELGLQSIDVYEKYRRNRSRDTREVVTERARGGAFKSGLPSFLSRWTGTGESAFVWREMVLLWRTGRPMFILMVVMNAGVCAFFGKMDMTMIYSFPVPMMLVLLGSSTASNLAQTGTKEFLKRNDLIRPLPLSYGKLLRTEAFARCMIGVVVSLAGVAGWAVFAPWSLLIAPFVLFCALGASFAFVSTVNLVTILLPDIEDPTQRSFRQMVQSLGVMLALALVSGTFIGLTFATHGLAIPAIVAGLVGIGIGWLASMGAERAYANYVPSE